MIPTPNYIMDTAKVILACELSQQPAWRGSSSDDPQLVEMAERMLLTPGQHGRVSYMVRDAIKAAWAVHRHLMPKMVDMVEKAWHASQSSDQKFTASEWKKAKLAIVAEVLMPGLGYGHPEIKVLDHDLR
jgi:hypothetical protein